MQTTGETGMKAQLEKSGEAAGTARVYILPEVMREARAAGAVRDGASRPSFLEVSCLAMGWLADVTYFDSVRSLKADDHVGWMQQYAYALNWSSGMNDTREAMGFMLDMCEVAFPPTSFERINLCYVAGYTPDESLQPLLKHLARICSASGTIRWIEGTLPVTSSRACRRLCALAVQAAKEDGRSFYYRHEQTPFVSMMVEQLRRAGFDRIRQSPVTLDVSYGSVMYSRFTTLMHAKMALLKPFLLDMQVIDSEEYEQLLASMLDELQDQRFRGRCTLYTVWGSK